MKAYVITIGTPTATLDHLEKEGVHTQLVEGVNARKESRRDLLERTSGRDTLPLLCLLRQFAPTVALAISLSHLHAWKAFLESEDPFGIMFEDDVVVEPNFAKRLEMILESYLPRDTEVLMLGNFFGDPFHQTPIVTFTAWVMRGMFNMNERHGPVNEHVWISKHFLSSHAYLLTRSGAQKLVELISQQGIHSHLDVMMNRWTALGQLNSYVTVPRLAFQTSSAGGGVSSTTSSRHHPYLFSKWARSVSVDEGVSLDFFWNVEAFQSGNVVMTAMNGLFLLLGILFCGMGVSVETACFVFALFSLPDVWMGTPAKSIWLNCVLLLLPLLSTR